MAGYSQERKVESKNEVWIKHMKIGSEAFKIELNEIKDPFVFYSTEFAGKALNNQKINFQDIRSIRFKSKESNGRAIAIGSIVGGGFGAFIGYRANKDEITSSYVGSAIEGSMYAALTGAIFGTVGAIVGSFIKTEHQYPIIGSRNNFKKYEKEIQKRLLE